MTFILEPRQLLFAILAGWVNRKQQEVIDYLRTENRRFSAMRKTTLAIGFRSPRLRMQCEKCKSQTGEGYQRGSASSCEGMTRDETSWGGAAQEPAQVDALPLPEFASVEKQTLH